MAAQTTMPLNIDLGPVSEQLRSIAYTAAAEAFKDVSKTKHAFAAYLDVKGVAAYLGCSTAYVYTLERRGLPVTLVDTHRMYSRERVDTWMREHEA
jgi:hypothetical protein